MRLNGSLNGTGSCPLPLRGEDTQAYDPGLDPGELAGVGEGFTARSIGQDTPSQPPPLGGGAASVSNEQKRSLIQLAAVWLTLLAIFSYDWAAMFDQWWNSSTFNHILLIPLIIGWLVQQRLDQLAKLESRNWWPGLVLFGGAVLLWVLGAAAGLAVIRQLGAVGVLIASALAILGPRVGAGLAFPLGYMLLLVPFGDELVPALQMITAKITIALVHLSGIPAVIDGVFINTPAGLFEVAEACSGVKFLIAMFAFGVLVANVCFVSWWRRLAFMPLSLVVPVLANGLRAWGTIFAAQFVGVEKAAGIDHIIYGWVFFGIVIALTLALAWKWFDRASDAPLIDADAINASPLLARLEAMATRPAIAIVLLALLLLGGKLWVAQADALAAPLPKQIFLAPVSGWQQIDYKPREAWQPRATGAEHRLLGRYADARGNQVDVFYALYAAQGPGRKASGFGEGALTPESGWSWHSAGPAVANAKSDRLVALHTARIAETYYRSGNLLTGSASRLSLGTMQSRLLLRARPTVLLILSAEERPGRSAADALNAFRQSAGPLDQWIDRTAQLR
jgi:exosortase A